MILGSKIYVFSKFSLEKINKIVAEDKVKVLVVVPTLLNSIVHENFDILKKIDGIICGGDVLSPCLAKKIIQHGGDKLYSLYGSTEVGFSVLATPKNLKDDCSTIGKIIPGVSLKIIGENNQEVGQGNLGELAIKNKWSWKKKDYILTGDIGYKDKNGNLFIKGRKDKMIISNGINIYPNELESVLYLHGHIKDCSVIGVNDEVFGQRLVAFITLEKTRELEEHQLIKWLEDRVQKHQLPRKIHFIESIPLTEIGKVNLQKLNNLV